MSNRNAQVICIGAATLDAIVVVDPPLPSDARIAVEQGGVAGGGPAATAAVAMARQGIRVAFAGLVGDDEAGAMVASGLVREGVDTSLLQTTDEALTAFSAVMVDRATAGRLILTRPGPIPQLHPEPALLDAVRAAGWIHLDQTGWAALGGLRGALADALVSLDGGNPIPDLDLSGVALYAPSEAGLRAASGTDDLEAGMRWALEAGASLVVVTRGPEGAAAMSAIDLDAPDAEGLLRRHRPGSGVGAARRIDEPAHRQQVVSTLGAGDVFHGILLAAICEGRSVREALRAASVGAGLSCRGLDGRSAIPDREALAAAIAELEAAERVRIGRVRAEGAPGPSSAPPVEAAFRALARPSGVFAMVAIDQRESLRAMLATEDPADIADAELVAFKRDVARALSGRASAMLVDRPFGLPAIAASGGVTPPCGLIVAADVLEQEPGGPIRSVSLDREAAAAARSVGAVALKLLVPWRATEPVAGRERLVGDFVELCRREGLLALVEALASDDGEHSKEWLGTEGILAAAEEMARWDFDLYKAQVPTFGEASVEAIAAIAAGVTERVGRPWVVLSNGVRPERFETGVTASCRGGASGFLAGRAIWTSALRVDDRVAHLEDVSARRLDRLVEIVDAVARPWPDALPLR